MRLGGLLVSMPTSVPVNVTFPPPLPSLPTLYLTESFHEKSLLHSQKSFCENLLFYLCLSTAPLPLNTLPYTLSSVVFNLYSNDRGDG